MKEITKAILQVMEAVKNVEKQMTVGTGQSSYKAVSDSLVRNTIRPEMVKAGLVVIPVSIDPKATTERWTENSQYGEKTRQQIFTEAICKYKLIHSESGESLEISGYGHGVDSQDKSAGKATTYALKNALLDTFLITKGESEDTDAVHSDDMPVPKTKLENKSKKQEVFEEPF